MRNAIRSRVVAALHVFASVAPIRRVLPTCRFGVQCGDFVPCSQDGNAFPFGAPYSIAASPLPRIDGNDVVFTATYSSPCDGGRSEFEAQRFREEESGHWAQQSLILVAVRHEPTCASPSPFEREVTLEVRAPLPASTVRPRRFKPRASLACRN